VDGNNDNYMVLWILGVLAIIRLIVYENIDQKLRGNLGVATHLCTPLFFIFLSTEIIKVQKEGIGRCC